MQVVNAILMISDLVYISGSIACVIGWWHLREYGLVTLNLIGAGIGVLYMAVLWGG